nr:integrase, catalytic region, zinc finger, CCHC-type, peptidase aspartic, catalytic [Tanacetum cinerariifolium]
LSAAAKGKQPARATTLTEAADVERTKAKQLKIVLKWSRQETHISQQHGSGIDEGTGSRPGGREESEGDKTDESDDDDDEEKTTKIDEQEVAESDKDDDEATESDRESEDEETREQEEESFDLIPRTPEDDEDDNNNEEDQGLRIVSQETEDTHVILTLTQSDAQQESSSTSSFMTNLLNPITGPDNGTEFFIQTLREYYEQVGISHETYVARSPQQSGIVERHNRTLIEVARTMLIYARALSGPVLHEMTHATISSGLASNPTSSTPFVPPSRTDWNLLFQPLFDELLTPPPIDQDAPSPSNSHSTPKTQPPVILNNVEEDNHDIEVVHMSNDPYFGIPIPEATSDQSSSTDVIHTTVHPDHQISEHNSKWTKDHPLENIIIELTRPVYTRL